MAHFDFVVHAPLDDAHPTEPLFAVEFDGPTHLSPDVRRRDLAKNRLCLAAGLPLVRIDDAYLYRRERQPVIVWLVEMWDAYHKEIPGLIGQTQWIRSRMKKSELRDAEEDWRSEYYFYTDPDRTFRMNHPFPSAMAVVERLAADFDFHEGGVLACYGAVTDDVRRVTPRLGRSSPLWRVREFDPPRLLEEGLIQRWECAVVLSGAHGDRVICEQAELRAGYPISERSGPGDILDFLERGEFPFLPSGPWLTAPYFLGPALCVHNTLLAIERFLRRQARRNPSNDDSAAPASEGL